jgi:hypothetical protein
MTDYFELHVYIQIIGHEEVSERFDAIESLLAGRALVKRWRQGSPRGMPERGVTWKYNRMVIDPDGIEDDTTSIEIRALRLLSGLETVIDEFGRLTSGLDCVLYYGASVFGETSIPYLGMNSSTLRPFLDVVESVCPSISCYLGPRFDDDGDCYFCGIHRDPTFVPRET